MFHTSMHRLHTGDQLVKYNRGTKVGHMLTLAFERYTAGFCLVSKQQTRSTCIAIQQSGFYGNPLSTYVNILVWKILKTDPFQSIVLFSSPVNT